MAISSEYLSFIKDQLAELGDIEVKKMFGGHGFFKAGVMFAMVGNDVFRLKVDSSNQQDYISKGMEPYHSNTKKKGMPYWEVPADVLEDKSELTIWANKSIEIAKLAAGK